MKATFALVTALVLAGAAPGTQPPLFKKPLPGAKTPPRTKPAPSTQALPGIQILPGKKPLPGAKTPPSKKRLPRAITIQQCPVFVIDKYDIDVPAQDAGVLISLAAYEGMQVYKDNPLAKIDDMDPQMRKSIAELERIAARKRADNKINEEYASAAYDVANADYARDLAANERTPGTISESQLNRDQLDAKRAGLQIQQAGEDRLLAELTANVKEAEVEAADKAIERREIRAPIDGEVTRVYFQVGEWVKPGDPILQIKSFDTLRVKTRLMAAEFRSNLIDKRPVTVVVKLAGDRTAKFQGAVTFVSQEVESDRYQVWADVANRKEGGTWLLQPGLRATMTIHLK